MGAVAITHPLGRAQVMPDLRLTFRTLIGHGLNPNAGAVIVVDHHKETGCSAEDIAQAIAKSGKLVEAVNIRECGGLLNAQNRVYKLALQFLREISGQRREEVAVRDLLLGLNCGTSDTTSGMSSNKATGYCSDLIIGQGGRSILAETTEMMGGEDVLAARASTPMIAQRIYEIVARMEKRALECGEDIRGSQPTGDNILGGLTTIEEKSLGAIQKAGHASIVNVLEYAQQPGAASGVYIMDTPGHGGESITGIAAGGAQILIFSTGGGHTINHPLMTTLRVTGNRISAEKMSDTVELDVSDIFDGTSIEEAGERIYNELLDTASGKLTKCEILRENNGFAIHRVGISI
jgi:altronate dehydratase large subunit